MKVIILHNLLWTHYRNRIFSELQHQAGGKYNIKVLQIARNERSRAKMSDTKEDESYLDYKYDLLFDKFIEEVGTFELTKKIIQKINEFKPNVVNLVGYYMPAQMIVMVYCWLKGIKIILSNDSTAADNHKSLIKTFIKKRLISMCSGFFNFGTLATDYMRSLGGIDAQMLANRCAAVDNDFIEKVYKKYLPIRDELQNEFEVSPKNFIFVGRFIEIKNLFLLLDAFAKTKQITKNSKWGLILLGDGILKEKLQDYIAENKIEAVHFISGKPWYEVPKFLTMADVFVLPSTSEPWGLVANEAMNCNMPVIVSDKCGCAIDLVKPNENGYIFESESMIELSSYMLKFINEEVNIQKMGEISKEIVQEFTPQKVAKSMLEGIQRVCSGSVKK